MGTLFVGNERKGLVDQLLSAFDRVGTNREPQMIVLVASPGWGKTRIVQEFYRKLAARQRNPPYWPGSLVGDAPDGGLSLSELTAGRKAVRHHALAAPPEGVAIPWLWLAPASGRLSDGSAAPALEGLIAQLAPHMPALLDRFGEQAPAGHGSDAAIPLEAAGLTARLGQPGERPQQIVGLLAGLLAPGPAGDGPPAVVVLDDAHELDAPTVSLVSEILSSRLPVLVVATTWPEKLTPVGSRPLPAFPAYLAEAAGSSRVTQAWLGELAQDDLIDYVADQFPATDQQVALCLAERAGHNPYALRLLLNTPRVTAAVRRGAIVMDPNEIRDLNGRLETLLAEHWTELPTGVRQVLVAAALIGESFIDEVLEAGLRRVHPPAGLSDALASSWIRPLGGSGRIIEFAERLRYEVAQGDVPNFLSARERADIYAGALRAVRRLLPGEPEGTGRVVLLALHILLAKEGIEDNLASAAASAAELAERARSEIRRLEGIEYYRLAVSWAERSQPLPFDLLVRCLIGHSTMTRIHYGRPDGEPSAARAVELADKHLEPWDELRIQARCALCRARRRRADTVAYESSWELLNEARTLLGQLDSPTAEATRDVRACEIGVAESEGDFHRAAALAGNLARFCEDHFGVVHRHTLSALSDLGYCLHRSANPTDAIAVRRTLLDRRIRRFNDAGHLQTAGAKNDLASSLLATRDPRNLPEAERLTEESLVSRSRAFGYDGRAARSSRSMRVRIWLAKGLLAESAGAPGTARDWFQRATDEADRLRTLRQDEEPSTQAVALQRHGEGLACLRLPDALNVLDDALEIRESQLGQDRGFWPVRECVKSLWWTYQRLGRAAEADTVARRYCLDGDPATWIPPFIPDTHAQSAIRSGEP